MTNHGAARSRAFFAAGLVVGAVVLGTLGLTRRAAPASDAPHPPVESSSAASLAALGEAGRTIASPIPPIPDAIELDPRRVALGRRLFHDPGLSGDGSVSCSSCHDIAAGGDDGRAVSIGVDGAKGERNAPSVLNSGFNFRQFWDGRARTLEEQVDGPLHNPAEMASDWPAALAYLASDASYDREFRSIYGRAPTRADVADAIATYERSLVTPGSAFDRWIGGDEHALSAEARAGYELFVALGCITCHQGVNTGGNMFQPLGKMEDYFASRGSDVRPPDLGRYGVTGKERDRFTFKVPSLRNVELTAPYFHDGSVRTLEEAVQVMASVQLGEDLNEQEVARLVAFLHALTGDIPEVP